MNKLFDHKQPHSERMKDENNFKTLSVEEEEDMTLLATSSFLLILFSVRNLE